MRKEAGPPLTGCEASVCFDLQLLDLLDQQGDVLQEVSVLLQQPLNSDLGVVAGVRLHRQLLPEDVHLRKTSHFKDRRMKAGKTKASLISLKKAHVHKKKPM